MHDTTRGPALLVISSYIGARRRLVPPRPPPAPPLSPPAAAAVGRFRHVCGGGGRGRAGAAGHAPAPAGVLGGRKNETMTSRGDHPSSGGGGGRGGRTGAVICRMGRMMRCDGMRRKKKLETKRVANQSDDSFISFFTVLNRIHTCGFWWLVPLHAHTLLKTNHPTRGRHVHKNSIPSVHLSMPGANTDRYT